MERFPLSCILGLKEEKAGGCLILSEIPRKKKDQIKLMPEFHGKSPLFRQEGEMMKNSIMIKAFVTFVLLALLVRTPVARARRAIPDDNLAYPVLITTGDTKLVAFI